MTIEPVRLASSTTSGLDARVAQPSPASPAPRRSRSSRSPATTRPRVARAARPSALARSAALAVVALLAVACDDAASGDAGGAGGASGGSGGAGGDAGGAGGTIEPGCAPGETPRGPEGACLPTGHADCAPPLQRAADGAGCAPIAAETCEGQQRPALGDPACRPAGPQSCPSGVPLHADGGCAFPELQSCTTGERRTVDGRCEALPGCDAPFPPAEASLFVGPAEVADGTTHFRSLAQALTAAPRGATIALEAGSFAGSFRIDRPVTLVGRCATSVTLQGDAATGDPALFVQSAAPVTLRGLTLRGGEAGLEAAAGAQVTLEGVVVEGTELTGLFVLDEGTLVTLRDSVVRDVRRQGGRFGVAASIGFGGRLVAEQAELSAFGDQGVYAVGAGSSASLTDVLVAGATARPGGALGYGLQADDGASLEATATRVTGTSGLGALARDGGTLAFTDVGIDAVAAGKTADGRAISAGLLAMGAGSRVTLTRVTVSETTRDGVLLLGPDVEATATDLALRALGDPASTEPSAALSVTAGATAGVEGLLVSDVAGDGVFVEDPGSRLLLRHALVRRTRPIASNFTGAGLAARDGGVLTIDDVTVLQSASAAVVAHDGGTIVGGGLLVRDVAAGNADPDGRYGIGLAAAAGTLTLGPLAVRGATAVAVLAQGSSLRLERAVIEGTRPDAAGDYGYGIAANLDGVASVRDATVREATRVGLFADGGALLGERVTVVDTRPGPGTSGRAIAVQQEGLVQLLDAALLRSTQVAVFAFRASLQLQDAFVGRAEKTADGRYGHGVELLGGANGILTGVTIVDQPAAGLVLADAAATLASCRFAGNAVALQAQDGVVIEERAALPDAPEPQRLLVDPGTVFEDNLSRVGAGVLPLSEPELAP